MILQRLLSYLGLLGMMVLVPSQISTAQQNLNDKKLVIEKNGGKMRILDAQGQDLSAQFRIQSMDIDLYDNKNQYAGSLSVQGDVFPLEEVQQGESIKINTLKAQETASGQRLEAKNLKVEWK